MLEKISLFIIIFERKMLISNIWIHLPYQDIASNSVQHGRTVATQNPSLSKKRPLPNDEFHFYTCMESMLVTTFLVYKNN